MIKTMKQLQKTKNFLSQKTLPVITTDSLIFELLQFKKLSVLIPSIIFEDPM